MKKLFHSIELSSWMTVAGIIFLFSFAIGAILIAPNFIDSTWTTPSSPYQVQMYEVEDPNIYLSSASSGGADLTYVHHIKQDFTLLVFQETENLRLISTPDLEKYITRYQEPKLKLTSRLLLLREPAGDMQAKAKEVQTSGKLRLQVLELYDPQMKEAFTYNPSTGLFQNWVDKDFVILDDQLKQPYHKDYGVVFVLNPQEFRISPVKFGNLERWKYDPHGQPVKSLDELQTKKLGFQSRKDLITLGEHIYAIEGCWYCHTDQTRTLIQDTVLNGSDSYPAPPSSANEYIYQKITFPGTRRIGPDISRVAIKRPSRDWHMAHFWDPKTQSVGSIMPSFKHFFDFDPRGTSKSVMGIPNYRFEAIYQYLMTKGSRITPPTQAWWLGLDPIQTKEIIEGQRKLKP